MLPYPERIESAFRPSTSGHRPHGFADSGCDVEERHPATRLYAVRESSHMSPVSRSLPAKSSKVRAQNRVENRLGITRIKSYIDLKIKENMVLGREL